MMLSELELWINAIERYNTRLHLVGPGLLPELSRQVEACLPLLEHIQAPVIADLGSGSGLPGIPFALIHPQTRVVLIERSRNKCTFLTSVMDQLGLRNVAVLEADALKVDLGPYAALMTRAFSPKTDLNRAVTRMLEPGGRIYVLGTEPPLLDQNFEENVIFSSALLPELKLFGFTFNPQ